jgi:hypothetical protein
LLEAFDPIGHGFVDLQSITTSIFKASTKLNGGIAGKIRGKGRHTKPPEARTMQMI